MTQLRGQASHHHFYARINMAWMIQIQDSKIATVMLIAQDNIGHRVMTQSRGQSPSFLYVNMAWMIQIQVSEKAIVLVIAQDSIYIGH